LFQTTELCAHIFSIGVSDTLIRPTKTILIK